MIQPASVLHDAFSRRPDPRSVEIQRVFTVSPDVLWELFTQPVHYAKWWGPKNGTCTRCEIDLRVGGKWLTTISFPDGDAATMHGEYIGIEPVERLEFTWMWTTAETGAPPSQVLLEFRPRGEGSLLRLLHTELPEDKAEGHEKGWNSAFDCLEAHLATR